MREAIKNLYLRLTSSALLQPLMALTIDDGMDFMDLPYRSGLYQLYRCICIEGSVGPVMLAPAHSAVAGMSRFFGRNSCRY